MSLTIARAFGVALVVGSSGFLLRAEPPQAVGTWASIGVVDPSAARTGAAIVTLADGTTLVAGGLTVDGVATNSVVIHDPLTNSSTQVGQLVAPRVDASATRLDDGRVLITGGRVADLTSADAELYDPSVGASTLVALMAQPRSGHASALLTDGTVLIVGGTTVDGAVLTTAERFDPSTNSMIAATSMAMPRTGASATTLIDGRVLVAGGHDGTRDLASAELYSPVDDTFLAVDTQLSLARAGHVAVLLPHNNSVLIAGGTSAGAAVTSADLFLPAILPDPFSWGTGTFVATGAMIHSRGRAVVGPWGDAGYAFAAGGGSADGEVYRFATIETDKDDYAPGELAVITGSGWEPNEDVTLLFQEDPAVHPDYALTVRADGEGNFTHGDWAPEEHDLNVRFYLMAIGSRARAQITFTDSRAINSVTLNGGSSVTVDSGASIAVVIDVTTTETGSPKWRSTAWSIATTTSGVLTSCVNHANHDTAGGPYTESFTITAPEESGLYNAYFTAHAGDTCGVGSGASPVFTLANSVTVTGAGPTHLAFTDAAVPGVVNQCLGPIQIQTRDAANVPTNVTGSTEVSLAADPGPAGAGAFYSDSLCAASVTGVTIPANANAAGFYYKASSRGDASHDLSASAAGLSSASLTQPIEKAEQAVVVIAVPVSATYGQAGLSVAGTGGNGTGAFSYSHGVSTACTVDSTTGALAITSGSGTCAVTATKAADNDYNAATSMPGTIAINRAALTITAADRSKTYGDTVTFAGTEFMTTALVGLDTVTSVTLISAGAASGATVTAPGPTYAIAPSAAIGPGLINYNIEYVSGTLTVDARQLTIAALNRSKTYGDLVTFTGTEFTTGAGQLVNGDTVTSVTLTSDGAASAATVAAPGPNYAIVPSAAVGTKLGHYEITYVNGMLTVRYYGVCLLYNPLQPQQRGSTVPFKITLCNKAGKSVSSAGIAVVATRITSADGAVSLPIAASGNANPANTFRFAGGFYIYNLSLKSAAVPPGTWTMSFTVNGIADPAYRLPFKVK